jgi:hypothetical protein
MIFIPTLKPLAQGGVRFSDFHAPPCADFCTFLSAIDFGVPDYLVFRVALAFA